MRTLLCLTLAASALLVGCWRKNPPPVTTAPSTNAPVAEATTAQEDSTGMPASARMIGVGEALTAPVDYLGAVGQAKRSAEKTVTFASLQQAVQLFNAQEGHYPKELQELVAQRYLPRLPAAPYGTRIAYDPNSGQVKVVKK